MHASQGEADLPPLTLTVKQARVKVSNLGHSKIWQLIGEGQLATVKIGRRRLVIYKSLERLLVAVSETRGVRP